MNAVQLSEKLSNIIAANSEFTTWTVSTPHLLLLIKQAVEEEREACAKVSDERMGLHNSVSAAIRARGNT